MLSSSLPSRQRCRLSQNNAAALRSQPSKSPDVCGVIITTNHKTDGLYLPVDDRRHFVAWSDKDKEEFSTEYWNTLWQWFEREGMGHVAAYLMQYDLSGFDAKAPPPKTEAFWHIVNTSRAPEESELSDILDHLAWPAVVTLEQIASGAQDKSYFDFKEWLQDRRNRKQIPHRLADTGYEPVRNQDAKDQLWKINNKRQVVYAKAELPLRDKIIAVRKL